MRKVANYPRTSMCREQRDRVNQIPNKAGSTTISSSKGAFPLEYV